MATRLNARLGLSVGSTPTNVIDANGSITANTLAVNNNLLVVNSSGVFTTSTVNASSFTVGSNFIANSTGVTTAGYANVATTVSVGANVIANTTALFVGNSTVNTIITSNSFTLSDAATISNSGIEVVLQDGGSGFKISRNSFSAAGQGIRLTSTSTGNYINAISTSANPKPAYWNITAGANATYDTAHYFTVENSNKLKANSSQITTYTNTYITGDATITGNLTVSGTTTYINTTNLNVGDNIITLNADLGAVAPTENAGIEINRGTSANTQLIWNESRARWGAYPPTTFSGVSTSFEAYGNNAAIYAQATGNSTSNTVASMSATDSVAQLTLDSGSSIAASSKTAYINIKAPDYRGAGLFITQNTAPLNGANAHWFIGKPYTGGAFQIGYGASPEYQSNAVVTIASNTNIGIGNTTPADKLSLTGNAYVNGSVTIVGGTSEFILKNSTGAGGVDEGGELKLWLAANTSLNAISNTVSIDIYQNKLRIFETGSPNRGVYIDLSTAANTVGTNLLGATGGFTNGQSISVANLTITGSLTANSSTGTAGQVLTTNGSAVYWNTIAAGAAVGQGSNTALQYNDSGTTAGAAQFSYDKVTNAVTVGNSTVNSVFTATTTTLGANSTATAMYVAANGNIGVNTISPTSKLQVQGTATVSGVLTAQANVIANGQLIVANTVSAGNTTVTGFINVSSTANVGGAINARSDLTVNGALVVANTAALGNTTITGFANVTTTLAAGNTTITGFANISSTLAAGNTNITGTANVSTQVFVGNSTVYTQITGSQINADVVLANTVNTSKVILTGPIQVGESNGSSGQVLTSTGTGTQWTSDLTLSNLTVTSNVTVNGAVVIANTVSAGNTDITGYINVSSTANVGGALTVGGTANVTGNVGVAGYIIPRTNTGIYGNVYVTAISDVTGNSQIRIQTQSGQLTIGPRNTSFTHFETDRAKFYFDHPIDVVTGVKVYNVNNYLYDTGLVVSNGSIAVGTASITNAGIATLGNTTITGFANVVGNVTFSDTLSGKDLSLTGNLTVSGTTTYINTTTLNIGDNIVTLNADLPAVTAPSENVGFEVNRGTSANVALRWNETIDVWQTTNDGTTYATIATNNDVATAYSNAIAYSGNAAAAYANAIAYSGNAAAAYANAIAYAANASNISSGTLAFARLPSLYLGTTTIQSTSGAQAVSGITTLAAGNTDITGYINVSSTANVGGAVNFRSNVTANGQLVVANTIAGGNTDLTGYINVSTTANVGGVANFRANVVANGQLIVANTISVGNTTVTGFINVSTTAALGNTTVTGFINVSTTAALGNTTVTGFINVSSTANIGDVANFRANVVANGQLIVANTISVGNTTVTGFINVSSTANVGGVANFRANVVANGQLIVANTISGGNTTITGFINVSSTANVGGAINARSDLTVNGAVIIANTLSAGNTTLTGTLSANGGVGTAGYVLTSAGSGNVYWAASAGGTTLDPVVAAIALG